MKITKWVYIHCIRYGLLFQIKFFFLLLSLLLLAVNICSLCVCSYCCRIICHLSLSLKIFFFLFMILLLLGARVRLWFFFFASAISLPRVFFLNSWRNWILCRVFKKKKEMKIRLISAPVRCIPSDENLTVEDSFGWKYVNQLATSAMIDSLIFAVHSSQAKEIAS